ncbi:MAG: coproporphyrinogen-III oxidase family protein [Planctomycetota bacterium]
MAEADEKTKVGNYFISNYPPFSLWTPERRGAVEAVLAQQAPAEPPPLGLYIHLPFCRKRCDFCYFKVYTDKASGDIRRYVDRVLDEVAHYARQPYLAGRQLDFVYFGGGTPSYLSEKHLRELFAGLRERISWDGVREIAFECEPGTLQQPKIQALYELGVTRLSIGVENFDPEILELNNRAHRAKEIYRVFDFARDAGFRSINLDLIAGMVAETDDNWARCVEETAKLRPESVTIYQMEVPYNTTIYRNMKDGGVEVAPVADWATKRRWAGEAFARLESAGYRLGSAYTACLDGIEFLYRDALWHGADMLGVGVSSFSHLAGVHFQNEPSFEAYLNSVEANGTAVSRALPLTDEERLVREFVLQMKLGELDAGYFRDKFGVDVLSRFGEALERHVDAGLLTLEPDRIRATREGLMRIDTLLPDFFAEEHRTARYA